MSPTPVTYTAPGEPASYSWEATNEEVAARYGVPIESIVRFDLNTSPAPPALIERLIAAGRFVAPMSEYPPADYGRLVAAAAVRYGVSADELIVGSRRRRDPRHHHEGVPAASVARRSSRSPPTRCTAWTRSSAARR